MRQEVFEIVQKMDKDNIRTQMARSEEHTSELQSR